MYSRNQSGSHYDRTLSKVISIFMPPDMLYQLEEVAKRMRLTRSELLRHLLKEKLECNFQPSSNSIPTQDLPGFLKSYWEIVSANPQRTIVTGLGIISDLSGKVLIASRRFDMSVEHLTWGFPGCKLESLEFADELQTSILKRTGYSVEIGKMVSSRVFPDTTESDRQIITLYFEATLKYSLREKEIDPRYNQLRWVRPREVYQYFSTSVSDPVAAYLAQLAADC
jgi:hypothetical protein